MSQRLFSTREMYMMKAITMRRFFRKEENRMRDSKICVLSYGVSDAGMWVLISFLIDLLHFREVQLDDVLEMRMGFGSALDEIFSNEEKS